MAEAAPLQTIIDVDGDPFNIGGSALTTSDDEKELIASQVPATKSRKLTQVIGTSRFHTEWRVTADDVEIARFETGPARPTENFFWLPYLPVASEVTIKVYAKPIVAPTGELMSAWLQGTEK